MSTHTSEEISICDFFRAQSQYVWDRIGFARKMNLRISEVSVTEQLLYHFYSAYRQLDLPIRIFESTEEHRNGNDIEVLFRTIQGYVLFACQAKIAYKNGNYQSFHHKVAGRRQIDILSEYTPNYTAALLYIFCTILFQYNLPSQMNSLSMMMA